MEEENDYDAFFNSCNAPQESASWTDELQAIVESEGQNSRENFFQLCMKRKLADQDHSYKYSSSASRFEESSRTTINSLKDLEKIELTEDFVNDTDVLMKEMCNLGWNFNGMRMNSRNYVEEEDDRFNSFIIFFFICIVSSS